MKTTKKITKVLKWSILSAAIFSVLSCDSQDSIRDLLEEEEIVCADDVTSVDFKQVAYWSEDEDENLENIQFSQLTHIIYDQISVNADGTLEISDQLDDELDDLIEAVGNNGTLIMFSIGGANSLASIANNTTALATFNDQIEDLFDDYTIDGIDINWQFPDESDEDSFDTLIESIQETIHDQGKLLSFVVASGEDDSLTDSVSEDALDYADFINVLAVESANDDDLHYTTDEAKESIEYWTSERCVVKNKLVLAIPSQGTSSTESTKSYADIISNRLTDACLDKTASRTFYYYDGIPTVTDKTEYAQSNAGGVVLISLQNDTYDDSYVDDYSLLMTINSQINGTPNTICD